MWPWRRRKLKVEVSLSPETKQFIVDLGMARRELLATRLAWDEARQAKEAT